MRKQRSIKEKESEQKKFDKLLDCYNNTNSFIYSSLNMEIVCTILKGINVVLREINFDEKKSTTNNNDLTTKDFGEIKVAKLKNI